MKKANRLLILIGAVAAGAIIYYLVIAPARAAAIEQEAEKIDVERARLALQDERQKRKQNEIRTRLSSFWPHFVNYVKALNNSELNKRYPKGTRPNFAKPKWMAWYKSRHWSRAVNRYTSAYPNKIPSGFEFVIIGEQPQRTNIALKDKATGQMYGIPENLKINII